MKILRRTQFGNPVLRVQAGQLSELEILTAETQELITNMRYTLEQKQYGVGLAASQVGKAVAIAVVGIKPTPSRPDNPIVTMTVINPKITATYGQTTPKWEGCISFGDTKNFPYAQVPRYKKIRMRWLDEQARLHERDFEGITAHVLQHEVDHLNGILFVDKVKDTTSYMTIAEYKKRIIKKENA